MTMTGRTNDQVHEFPSSRLPMKHALFLFCAVGLAYHLAAADKGYQKQVAVQAPTRIDWVFAVSNQSPAQPPADWLPKYGSTEQKYELFVPQKYDPKKPAPLIAILVPTPVAEIVPWVVMVACACARTPPAACWSGVVLIGTRSSKAVLVPL